MHTTNKEHEPSKMVRAKGCCHPLNIERSHPQKCYDCLQHPSLELVEVIHKSFDFGSDVFLRRGMQFACSGPENAQWMSKKGCRVQNHKWMQASLDHCWFTWGFNDIV